MSETLGQRLRKARKGQGLSQEELAARAGVSPRTIQSMERDARKTQAAKVRAVMSVLGLEDANDLGAGYPADVRVLGEAVMTYLETLTPEQRRAWGRRFIAEISPPKDA